jgi:hypothetical protein
MTSRSRFILPASAVLVLSAACHDATILETESTSAPTMPAFAISAGGAVPLGYYGGGNTSHGVGINSSGVVVGSASDETFDSHAIRWAPGQAAVKLDTFAINTTGLFCTGVSQSRALNDEGYVVGRMRRSECGTVPGIAWIATMWAPDGQELNLPRAGTIQSEAVDINNKGQVVVIGRAANSGRHQVFRWSAATGMQELGAFFADGSGSVASAVNDAGVVVGRSSYPDYHTPWRAVRWTASGELQDLGLGNESDATDINEHGQIIGYYLVNGETHGYVRNPDGSLVDLGLNAPMAINNHGVVVGTNRSSVAWAWSPETGMVLLPGQYARAQAINDDGIITGNVNSQAVTWSLSGMVRRAPPAPTSPAAVAGYSPTRVTLSWTDASASETSFTVRRRTMNANGTWGPFVVLRNTAANVTSIVDSAVVLNTTYQYRVSACSPNGCSASVASGYVSPVTLPTAPTNLSAAAVTGTRIQVTWTDASSNESKYPVRRREKNPDGSWTQYVKLAERPANSTSYTDTAAVPGKTYMYNVNVCNAVGCVAGPVSAAVTTPTIPAAPAGVAAAAVSATRVNVSWTDQSANEAAFKLWRRVSNGDGTWGAYVALPDAGTNATSAVDTSMPSGATYQYRVRACNAAGCSVGVNSPAVTVPAG